MSMRGLGAAKEPSRPHGQTCMDNFLLLYIPKTTKKRIFSLFRYWGTTRGHSGHNTKGPGNWAAFGHQHFGKST